MFHSWNGLRVLATLCAGGAAIGACSHRPPAPPPTSTPAPTPSAAAAASALPTSPRPRPSRYVPGDGFRSIGDGRRGAIVSRRRVVISDGGTRVLDEQPVDDLGAAHRIPIALGGGMLFVGERTVRFAPTFDAPLAVVGPSVTPPGELRVGVGHRCVLVGTDQSTPTLHALPGGGPLALSPPGLVQLFGTPQGMVAARTAAGELFVSPADGAPFAKLPAPEVNGLRYDGKGVVVDTDREPLRLGFDGKLGPRPSEASLTVASNVDAFMDPFPDPALPPPEPSDIERLVDPLTGRMSAATAIALRDGDLLFLDGVTGKVFRTVADAFAGRANCSVIRGGQPSFVGCNGDTMTLFRIDSPEALPVIERELPNTYTFDFGEPSPNVPLVLGKRCDGTVAIGALCVRQAADRWRDVPPPSDPMGLLGRVPFIVHVAASPAGDAYGFGWLDGGGDLIVIDGRAKTVRRIPSSSMPSWASRGVDWHNLVIEAGTLRFLLSNTSEPGSSAGIVEIRADDTSTALELEGTLSAIGSRGLLLAPTGELRETVEGRTFRPVEPPPGGVFADGDDFLRCVPTGCEIGPWYRVGWGPLKAVK